jgi:hypothetical protein
VEVVVALFADGVNEATDRYVVLFLWTARGVRRFAYAEGQHLLVRGFIEGVALTGRNTADPGTVTTINGANRRDTGSLLAGRVLR